MSTSRKPTVLVSLIVGLLLAAVPVLVTHVPAEASPSQRSASFVPERQSTDSALGVAFSDDRPVRVNTNGNVLVSISAFVGGRSDVTIAVDGTIQRQGRHLSFAIEGPGSIAGSTVLHVSPGRHSFSLRYFAGSANETATYQNRALSVSDLSS
jgi:hypothetical protein